jgi:deazaflavin-dependent oxidoreductase (nitroreductase family)
MTMAEYIPPALDWVRKQVEEYEGSGGTRGTTLRDSGLPCIIVTHKGNKTGGIRKIPLMRVKVGNAYVLVGSYGGREKNPVWVYNLRADGDVEIRDATEVFKMKVREVPPGAERDRLWAASAEAFPNYLDYQKKTSRLIPVFIAEPI